MGNRRESDRGLHADRHAVAVMGSQLASGLGGDGINLLVHGPAPEDGHRYQLGAGSAARCATGNHPGAARHRSCHCCLDHADILSTHSRVPPGSTGNNNLSVYPPVAIHRALDKGDYGPAAAALDILDAGRQQYAAVALAVHNITGYPPKIPYRLNTMVMKKFGIPAPVLD